MFPNTLAQATLRLFLLLISSFIVFSVKATASDSVTIIFTTDVHGCFFPYDFINGVPTSGSLARVATVADHIRSKSAPGHVILLDNGDFLQGQPSAYYYNFIDTVSPHLAARIFNYLNYTAVNEGNHDIETGHAVYDHVASQLAIPTLGANVIDIDTSAPYFKPYIIHQAGDHTIAVLGLITPAIPAWLPPHLWSGMRFDDMVATARYWVEEIRRKYNPDLVIGLFHSGHDSRQSTAGYRENESLEVARRVGGFDAILMGHDHYTYCDTVAGPDGKPVWALNPANNAKAVGVLDVRWLPGSNRPDITGTIMSLDSIEPSATFMEHFAPDLALINEFVNQPVTNIAKPMSSRDALNGPSDIMTLIHQLQLDVTGARISLAAPLSTDAEISQGQLTMADMFKLYKYENNLCVLHLTGRELLGHLEESYRQWLDKETVYPIYNYDSAYGIDYTVDSSAAPGARVEILSFSDGTPFSLDSIYTVAVNSYRAGGGGNHLTLGAGIPPEQLPGRIISTTPKDIRYYLIEYLRRQPFYQPHTIPNWHFRR